MARGSTAAPHLRTERHAARLVHGDGGRNTQRRSERVKAWKNAGRPGFIGKKERHCSVDDNSELGDVWTFCAIDSETKLVPSFKCGKRNAETANAFVQDIANRVRNRVQISIDALAARGASSGFPASRAT